MSLNLVILGYRFQYASFVGKVIAYAGFIENYPVSYFETPPATIDGSPVISMVSFGKGVKFIQEGEANCCILMDLNFMVTAEKFISDSGTILFSNDRFIPAMELIKKDAEILEVHAEPAKKIRKQPVTFNHLPSGGDKYLKKALFLLGAFAALNGYVERENLVSSIEKHLHDSNELYFESFWKGYEEIKGKID